MARRVTESPAAFPVAANEPFPLKPIPASPPEPIASPPQTETLDMSDLDANFSTADGFKIIKPDGAEFISRATTIEDAIRELNGANGDERGRVFTRKQLTIIEL
jgi:hypothetical protein